MQSQITAGAVSRFQTGNGFETVIEQIEHLRNKHPLARIVIVADCYRLAELVAAFRAGANGYFVDILSCDVFIRSLELVTLGQKAPAFLSFVLGPEGAQLCQEVAPIQKSHAIPSAPTEDGLVRNFRGGKNQSCAAWSKAIQTKA